jgi:hypothetical protein
LFLQPPFPFSGGNPRSVSLRSDVGNTTILLSLLGASSLEHYLIGVLILHQRRRVSAAMA